LGKTNKMRFSEDNDNRPNQDKNPSKLWLILAFAAAGGFIAYNLLISESSPSISPQGVDPSRSTTMKLGGDWLLTDMNSQPFSSKQLRGQYYLIYFGFTKCPEICPTTLNYITSVVRIARVMMGSDIPLKIVFVSIDPERDTPEVLKKYLKIFGKDVIGVTASSINDENLKDCMQKYKIYANKVTSENGNYNVDHTTMVYLMDTRSLYLGHINPSLTEKQSATNIIEKIL